MIRLTEDEYRRLIGIGPPGGSARARNKYHARRTVYAGRSYDSEREADHAAWLDLWQRSGHIRFWIPQVTFDLGPDDRLRVDFLVVDLDGRVWAEEIKGIETRDFARKRRLWEKYGPCSLKVIYKDRTETIAGGGAK